MSEDSKPERRTLPPFPVDEATLSNVMHSLEGVYAVDEEGNHNLVGSEFSFSQLLDFLSGYDPNEAILIQEGTDVGGGASLVEQIGGAAIYHYPHETYHHTDVIRALIQEIERLRALHPDE